MLLLVVALAHARSDPPICLLDVSGIEFPQTRSVLNRPGLRLEETVKPNLLAAQTAFCTCAGTIDPGDVERMELEVAVRPIDGRAVGTLTVTGGREEFRECLPAEVETRFEPYSMPTDMVIDGESGEGSFVYPVQVDNLPTEPQLEEGREQR